MMLFLWIWYGLVFLLPRCNGKSNNAVENRQLLLRSLAADTETISTADCSNAPVGSYHARLDLYYFYLLEYEEGLDLDLRSVAVAIATDLVKVLNECDEYDRPKFAVSIAPSAHVLSDGDGICEAVTDGNVCRVARGTASILLPLDGDIIDLEALGYDVVQRVLDDTSFLKDYTGMPLMRSEFVRPIGENLVFLVPSNSSGDSQAPSISDGATLKVAICAAFISFIVTSIFVYGIYRKRKAGAGNSVMKTRLAHYQAKRRQYFHELQGEDSSHEPGWMTTEVSDLPREPSITWSVSDLTSDSQSIRSSLPMDRIAEEHDEENTSSPSNSPASMGDPQSSLAEQHLQFISHWKDATGAEDVCGRHSPNSGDDLPYQSEDEITPVHRNGVEEYDATTPMSPCGIRYLDDSTEETSSTVSLVDTEQEDDHINSSIHDDNENNAADQTNDSDAHRAVLRLPRGPDLGAMLANLSLSEDSNDEGDEYEFTKSSPEPSDDNCGDPGISEYDGPVLDDIVTNQVLSLNGSEVLGEHFVGTTDDQGIHVTDDDSDDDYDSEDDDEESSTVTRVRFEAGVVVADVTTTPVKEAEMSTPTAAATGVNTSTEVRLGEGPYEEEEEEGPEEEDDSKSSLTSTNSSSISSRFLGLLEELPVPHPSSNQEQLMGRREQQQKGTTTSTATSSSLLLGDSSDENAAENNSNTVVYHQYRGNDDDGDDDLKMQRWVESVLTQLEQLKNVKRLSM